MIMNYEAKSTLQNDVLYNSLCQTIEGAMKIK